MDVQPLSAAELLQVWEWGQGQPPVRRALALLAAACPEWSLNELASLPIGRRDALLLALRERTFGRYMTVTTRCPQCAERLELEAPADELRKASYPVDELRKASYPADAAPLEGEDGPLTVTSGDWRVVFRLPASQDLLALPPPGGDPRAALLALCLLNVWQGEEPREPGDLPEAAAAAVLAAMAGADPLAEIRLALTCPGCAHQWRPVFDPLAFFWEEIGSWAAGILQEVHLLASAYGWNESEILALSPWRRRAYLEMVLG